MCQLNDFGAIAALNPGVHAMTDVTGFGLLGHLLEICENDTLGADVDWHSIPTFPDLQKYLREGCSPGGALRNFESYGQNVGPLD